MTVFPNEDFNTEFFHYAEGYFCIFSHVYCETNPAMSSKYFQILFKFEKD